MDQQPCNNPVFDIKETPAVIVGHKETAIFLTQLIGPHDHSVIVVN